MANNNYEESNPLLSRKLEQEVETKHHVTKPSTDKPLHADVPVGLPVGGDDGGMMMMQKSQWDTGIFSCLGKNDEFYSSDLEVCLLGTMVPCVLHGSNIERLGSAPGNFANHCLPYTALYVIGNTFFGWNCLAPWFSYPNRTAIRRKFNLEGSCEALAGSSGCCGKNIMDDEIQREQCESSCDFATHIFCHACALCQEAREVRRRLPHPGFTTAQPVLLMIPPEGQTMGHGAA